LCGSVTVALRWICPNWRLWK